MTSTRDRRRSWASRVAVAAFATMLAIPATSPAGAADPPPPSPRLRVVSRLLSDGNLSTTFLKGKKLVGSAETGPGTRITLSPDGGDIELVPDEKLDATGHLDESGGSTASDEAIMVTQEAFLHPDKVVVRDGKRSIRWSGHWRALPTRQIATEGKH